jgi:hypothetical protein
MSFRNCEHTWGIFSVLASIFIRSERLGRSSDQVRWCGQGKRPSVICEGVCLHFLCLDSHDLFSLSTSLSFRIYFSLFSLRAHGMVRCGAVWCGSLFLVCLSVCLSSLGSFFLSSRSFYYFFGAVVRGTRTGLASVSLWLSCWSTCAIKSKVPRSNMQLLERKPFPSWSRLKYYQIDACGDLLGVVRQALIKS